MKIELINVFNELDKYVGAVENGESMVEQWEKIVIAPYWEKLCCYAPMDLTNRKPAAVQSIAQLKKQVHILKNLDMEALNKEFERITSILPNYDDDTITVALFPSDAENRTVNEKQNGVVGTSLFGNLYIQINPLVEGFENWIQYVFAHEYHHTVWGNYWFMLHGGTLKNKFIDSLVIDGEADSFALEQYPDLKPSWIFNCEQDAASLWDNIYSKLALEQNVDYEKYMFGSRESNIPWCAGYAVGYWLIQNYLHRTQKRIIDILEVKPEDML